jgi:hypothetical protein
MYYYFHLSVRFVTLLIHFVKEDLLAFHLLQAITSLLAILHLNFLLLHRLHYFFDYLLPYFPHFRLLLIQEESQHRFRSLLVILLLGNVSAFQIKFVLLALNYFRFRTCLFLYIFIRILKMNLCIS